VFSLDVLKLDLEFQLQLTLLQPNLPVDLLFEELETFVELVLVRNAHHFALGLKSFFKLTFIFGLQIFLVLCVSVD
jgi:hypothetical protein